MVLFTILSGVVFGQEKCGYPTDHNLIKIVKELGELDSNGERTGEWKLLWLDGEYEVGNYKKDKKQGQWKRFYGNGKLQQIGNYKDNEKSGKWKEYSYEHLTKVVNYVEGKLTGKWKEYHKNGKIRTKGNYKNGTPIGEWRWYYENGKLNSIQNRNSEGYLEGEYKVYDGNGKIEIIGWFKTFKKENKVEVKKSGEWKYYDEQGKLIKTENF